jgi:choline dehydrogenase-like flavoprotein
MAASSDTIVIVGAGASAVHVAATALDMGRRVVMLDVGRPRAPFAQPDASLNQLKQNLDDPSAYFLGEKFEALILPSHDGEYYGLPPSKSYVFETAPGQDFATRGFEPLNSFAAGGLAEAWTGGAYAFNAGETEAFPFEWSALDAAYGGVAKRIGVSGVVDDDLSHFYPAHEGLLPPIELDAHSNQLLRTYSGKRDRLSRKHNIFMGRARSASLSRDHGDRKACTLSGRCLWGCPTGAFYTPSLTLRELRKSPSFEYVPDVVVEHFEFDESNRVTHVVARHLTTGEEIRREVGELVLAAGALGSSRIVLESMLRAGERVELKGLMDNRQVHMPFVNFARIGQQFDDRSYQYHQLAVGAPGEHPFDYVHGLITTLTTAMIHPLVQTLPLGVRASTALFKNLHGALGLMNINFADTRRDENRMTLEVGSDGRSRRLLMSYTPESNEADRLDPTVKRFRDFLLALGCIAPPHMTRLRPMGASVHYAGTLPMLADGGDLTTDRTGRVRPFANLIAADGATFPSLPAKNLTFTLMANATRIAREALA